MPTETGLVTVMVTVTPVVTVALVNGDSKRSPPGIEHEQGAYHPPSHLQGSTASQIGAERVGFLSGGFGLIGCQGSRLLRGLKSMNGSGFKGLATRANVLLRQAHKLCPFSGVPLPEIRQMEDDLKHGLLMILRIILNYKPYVHH